MIDLGPLPPAAFEAWTVVFDLAREFADDWVVVGGQMVQLHAVELGARDGVRPTVDVDVIVDIRARRSGTMQVASWLTGQGFAHGGMSPFGIGHRYRRAARDGPGSVLFDVLAPEGVGENANRLTTPPARTVLVPGGTQALKRAELVEVAVSGLSGAQHAHGHARRPNVLGALVAKAAATSIVGRTNPDRDWQDAALLLSRIDPFELAPEVDSKDRERLRRLRELEDRQHPGWELLTSTDHRRATAALDVLLSSERTENG